MVELSIPFPQPGTRYYWAFPQSCLVVADTEGNPRQWIHLRENTQQVATQAATIHSMKSQTVNTSRIMMSR